MILQSLNDYYMRKAADPQNGIAPEGWEIRPIPYLVVIDQAGRFLRIESTEEGDGKRKQAKSFLVPQSEKRTVGVKAYLLWDNIEYALGANPRGRDDIAIRHLAFRDKIRQLPDSVRNHPQIVALNCFLDGQPVTQIEAKEVYAPSWQVMLETNAFMAFKVDGCPELTICDVLPKISVSTTEDGVTGVCLISGEETTISRLHPAVKGGAIRGTNTAGAALVSFNLPAFGSYGKTQNFNAPISESAAFGYTTAINLLSGRDSANKFSAGEGTTILFWSQQRTQSNSFNLESEFGWFFADAPKDDPDRNVAAVKALYAAIHTGAIPENTGDRFFILGLAPNAARIAVRFWKQGTIKDTANHMKEHFDDFAIVHGPKEEEYLPLGKILRATALEYKLDNVPPKLAGDMVQAILDVSEYPQTLLQQCVRRIRAEQQVGRTRAAICKAVINRQIRRNRNSQTEKEITVALDTSNTNVGYVLGRLFAVLERCQEQAQGNLNASIRERYYGAFSSTPITVLPTLLKLNKHHLAKLAAGQKTWFDKQMGEVMAMVDAEKIPANLRLPDQAKFAVGYYHQRQDFFKSKETGIPEASK